MTQLGTEVRPLRVAIVGSGPSGFYAAAALLAADLEVRVDMLDRLPTPFGLVRGGVAPDHQKIKGVVRAYLKTAEHPRFRFFGNVDVGHQVRLEDLRAAYDAVVLAIGAESARSLGIPGEDLAGSHDATSFVGWYNGHPAYQERVFDLSVSTAVVVGVGNVAMDVTRLLVKAPEALRATDITATALEALERSQVRDVHVLGRRGAAQAAFSPAEIREIDAVEGVDLRVRVEDAQLDPLSEAWLEASGDKAAHQNVAFLKEVAARGPHDRPRRVHLHLLTSPIAYEGTGRVERVVTGRNEIMTGRAGRLSPRDTGERGLIEAGLVLRAVGYRGVPLPGAPFDAERGTIPHEQGRVCQEGRTLPGLYVVGWAKRGPTGLIGTNRADARETVASLLEDVPSLDGHAAQTEMRFPGSVSWADWQRLDRLEVAAGAARGKIREKFVAVAQMLEALDQSPGE